MKKIFSSILILLISTIHTYAQGYTCNHQELTQEIDSLKGGILIQTLKKWEHTNDNYFELNIPNNCMGEALNKMYDAIIDTVYFKTNSDTTEYTVRMSLHRDSVSKYANLQGLDTLLVLNSKNKVVDELYLSNLELYYEYGKIVIKGAIATYPQKRGKDYTAYTVVSKNGLKHLTEDINIKQNSEYSKRIFSINNFPTDSIFYSGYFLNKNDTISLTSFYDKELRTGYIYLLKNGKPLDVMIVDNTFKDIRFSGLRNKDEIVLLCFYETKWKEMGKDYTYSYSKPIGIDLEKMKFINHIQNRVIFK